MTALLTAERIQHHLKAPHNLPDLAQRTQRPLVTPSIKQSLGSGLKRSLARCSRPSLPLLLALASALPRLAAAQGFEKVNTTVTNVNSILVLVSVAVVTIAIIWAGFKMIFQGSRLSDVANILLGGTLVGGASAFAAFIVN